MEKICCLFRILLFIAVMLPHHWLLYDWIKLSFILWFKFFCVFIWKSEDVFPCERLLAIWQVQQSNFSSLFMLIRFDFYTAVDFFPFIFAFIHNSFKITNKIFYKILLFLDIQFFVVFVFFLVLFVYIHWMLCVLIRHLKSISCMILTILKSFDMEIALYRTCQYEHDFFFDFVCENVM